MSRLEELFVGIPPTYQAPVLMHFEDGQLATFIQGKHVKGWQPTE
ncbi:MAG: hypothetical protein AB8B55_13620 [Mariniblastus sp.]